MVVAVFRALRRRPQLFQPTPACLGPLDDLAASCGGRDAAVLLWKVIDGGDEEVDGEYIERPPAARPAWHEGCDITSTTDILRRARPLA